MRGYAIIVVISVFVWAGALIAISFMEAPLKFLAPGITTKLGLGIGRLVFHTLNKIEWLLAGLLVAGMYFGKGFKMAWIFTGIILFILTFQTFVLLPLLDERAQLWLNGTPPEPSWHHVFYVIIEFIKLISLIILGILYMKTKFKLYDTSGSLGIIR